MATERTSAVAEIRYPQQASYYPVELKELIYVHIGTVSSMSTVMGVMSKMGVLNEPIPGFSRLSNQPQMTKFNAETLEAASALIVKRARDAKLNAIIIQPPETDHSGASTDQKGASMGYSTLGILTSVPLNKNPHVFLVDGKNRDLSNIIRISNREHVLSPASGKSKKKRGACFIATACYGSYDCPQVMILRNFRDEVLRQSHTGRYLIFIYYRFSPYVAAWLNRNPVPFKRITRSCLDIVIKLLNS